MTGAVRTSNDPFFRLSTLALCVLSFGQCVSGP